MKTYEHREGRKAYRHQYYLNHKDKIKQYYADRPEKLKAYGIKYSLTHREEIKKRSQRRKQKIWQRRQ